MAKAFNQELVYHDETKRRMKEMSKHRTDIQNQTPEQVKARDRMALFPVKAEVLFVDPELWVVCTSRVFDYPYESLLTTCWTHVIQPIVRMERKLCVLPGIPRLFKQLLEGLKPYLVLPARDEASLGSDTMHSLLVA